MYLINPQSLGFEYGENSKRLGQSTPPSLFAFCQTQTKTMKHALNLKNKVKEYGHVIVFKAKAVSEEDYNTIVNLFQVEREKQYKEILEECHEFLQEIESNITGQKLTDEEVEEMEESLEGLERWFERVKAIDWISVSPRRKEVEKALEKCKDALTDFAERAQARGAIHQPKEEKRRE
jgi:DNA-binding transcriptional regulator GbsR (MarR family)